MFCPSCGGRAHSVRLCLQLVMWSSVEQRGRRRATRSDREVFTDDKPVEWNRCLENFQSFATGFVMRSSKKCQEPPLTLASPD